MHLLQNKVAVVTGGTRGISLATVRVFLEQGTKVALLGSRQESVDKTLAQLREQNPDWPLLGFWPALTDEQAVQQTLEKVARQESWKEKFPGFSLDNKAYSSYHLC